MEIIKGRVVGASEKIASEPEKEIEYFTAPVPVSRKKLPFGAVAAVQVLLSAAAGIFLWWANVQGGETGAFAEEIIRRFTNG